jgi:hypothetical protein
MPEETPRRRYEGNVGWSFGILAAVIVVILIGWGWGGQGHGWGRDQMAHMAPPAVSSSDGPASRAWSPPSGRP